MEPSNKTLAVCRKDVHEQILAFLLLQALVDFRYMEYRKLSSVPVLHCDLSRLPIEVDAVLVKTSAEAPVLVNFLQRTPEFYNHTLDCFVTTWSLCDTSESTSWNLLRENQQRVDLSTVGVFVHCQLLPNL